MKQNVGQQLTDAAAEFARVMEMLFENKTEENKPAYAVVNSYVKPAGSTHIIKIYGILLKRSADILEFSNDVQDEYIDEDLRKATAEAVATLRNVFSPTQFAAHWPQVKENFIRKQHIQTLKYFSRTMRAHRPLIKITDDNISAAKIALQEASDEILTRDDLPIWAQQTLSQAIIDLTFQLDNFLLCGHDEVIDQILQMTSKVAAVSSEMAKSGQAIPRLEKFALLLVLLVDLFTSAPNIAQALPVYKGWILNLSELNIPLLSPPPKQIEGPKANQVDNTDLVGERT